MFERTDAPKWNKFKLYIGAVTVLLPRILISVFILLLLVVVTTVLLIGKRSREQLQNGCRKYLLKLAYRITMNLIGFITFWTVISSKNQKNVSYEYYLGKEP